MAARGGHGPAQQTARTQHRPPVGPLGQFHPPEGDRGSHSPLPPDLAHPEQSRPRRPPAPGPAGPQPCTRAANASFGVRQASHLTVGSRTPHQWSPTPGPAPESPGPTPPPVSRHQPGALGLWKQPLSDQTLLTSSIHTGRGRATHLPARAPVITRGEGTPRTLPPHPGRETEPRDGKQMEPGQEEPAEEHAPGEEQDRPQQQTRVMRDGPPAAGVQSGDCGWPGARGRKTAQSQKFLTKRRHHGHEN